MTVSMNLGTFKLIFSDASFSDYRKKPTVSIYDKDANTETLVASFRSKEAFDWFIGKMREAHILYEKGESE
jgi:hypothetical protein